MKNILKILGRKLAAIWDGAFYESYHQRKAREEYEHLKAKIGIGHTKHWEEYQDRKFKHRRGHH